MGVSVAILKHEQACSGPLPHRQQYGRRGAVEQADLRGQPGFGRQLSKQLLYRLVLLDATCTSEWTGDIQ